MAERERIAMPAGSAGVLRFYDTESGGIKLEPSFVLIVTVLFILLILVAKFIV
jgi:preprotein translocase subunit Sec61beta